MADRNNNSTHNSNMAASVASKQIRMKQAEEAKLKSEAEKVTAAKAAFDATFNKSQVQQPQSSSATSTSSDSYDGDRVFERNSSVGPVDPSRCTTQGAGIADGTGCVGTIFTVATKDSEGRKLILGGFQVAVRVTPGFGVGGNEQDGIVKDLGDGSFNVT